MLHGLTIPGRRFSGASRERFSWQEGSVTLAIACPPAACAGRRSAGHINQRWEFSSAAGGVNLQQLRRMMQFLHLAPLDPSNSALGQLAGLANSSSCHFGPALAVLEY